LIALIIDAHRFFPSAEEESVALLLREGHGQSIEKTIFASNVPESAAVKPRPLQEIAQDATQKTPVFTRKA